jgi:uncharacterized protein (DUF1015 family)
LPLVNFRPFRGLRYNQADGDLGRLISPPYDVLTEQQVDELVQRDQHNVIRLEHPVVALRGETEPYAAAAAHFDTWQRESTLRRDLSPAFYVHRQEFEEAGEPRGRWILYGRLRLTDWEEGDVLPHEYTMAGPKEDRLRLMVALKANISPLYLLYDDPNREISSLVARAEEFEPIARADVEGERHSLWAVQDPVLVESLQRAFQGRPLYMADGHHRYETALAFHRQNGEAGTGYVLAGLTAGSDPGLSIHATHRLYSGELDPGRLTNVLKQDFVMTETTPEGLKQVLVGPELVLGVAGLDGPSSLYELRQRDPLDLIARVPGEGPDEWRRLDVNLLQHVVLGGYLGLDPDETSQPGLTYVHSVEEAISAVEQGHARLAFLLRPITPRDLFKLSDAGARLPQKTTYFYPKLPAGLVINPLD